MSTTQRIETLGLLGLVTLALSLGVAGMLGLTSPEPPAPVATLAGWINATLPWARVGCLVVSLLAMVGDREIA